MRMPECAVHVADLSKNFGRHHVLDQVSLELHSGTLYGLVGLNGTGKTTLIRLLLGLLRPDTGRVRVLGTEPWRHETALYRNAGVLLEHDGFFPNLDFRSNMAFFASAKGVSSLLLDEYLQQFWGDIEIARSRKKVKDLSRGQRMQCAICRAFLGWPQVCFLDEPVVSLDIEAYDHFCTLVKEGRSRGCTMVISSHVLDPIETLCDRVGLLRDRRLTEIEVGKQRWVLRTGEGEAVSQILFACGASCVVSRDQAWFFAVEEPDRQIPAIVARLVAEGHAVGEVRPDSGGLREMIRSGSNQ